jgi:hypothetical protein
MRRYGYLAGALCWLVTPAVGQVAGPQDVTSPCVDVAINGHAALSFDCLNRQLTRPAPASPAQIGDIDAVTREPGNRQVGQFNFSAFSHRMGSNLGISVFPQRPVRPPASPPPGTLPIVPVGTH